MARPREFDEHAALDKALAVFWRHGYEASSLAELLAAMELSKSSFYETFGSKHALFLEALQQYQDERLGQLRATLAGGNSARAAIEAFFQRIVGHATEGGNTRGCMACNEAVELAPSDATVRRQVERHLAGTEAIFAEAVRRGQADGSIGRRHGAERLARFLAVALNGLQVMARARSPRERLEDTVAVMLAALD
jgi:TetR/AcrR family transcriptional repressor of nem operon